MVKAAEDTDRINSSNKKSVINYTTSDLIHLMTWEISMCQLGSK